MCLAASWAMVPEGLCCSRACSMATDGEGRPLCQARTILDSKIINASRYLLSWLSVCNNNTQSLPNALSMWHHSVKIGNGQRLHRAAVHHFDTNIWLLTAEACAKPQRAICHPPVLSAAGFQGVILGCRPLLRWLWKTNLLNFMILRQIIHLWGDTVNSITARRF